MKRTKEVFKIFSLILIFIFIFSYHTSFADVGSFESYDSYDSDSSWSGSTWDGDSSYSDSNLGLSFILGATSGSGFLTFIIGLCIIFAIIYKASQNQSSPMHHTMPNINLQTKSDEAVEAQVKATDEMFNKEEFIAWAKDLFVKLQEAWTARDWSTIRTFETNELFEQHQKQLQGYINMKQINVLERICVRSAQLCDFRQSGDKDILSITLKSKMVDYIMDEDTKQVIKGDKVTDRYSTYKLVFIRKTGVKTKPGTSQVNTTNCPNCGAPTQIASSGKCEYCGSVVTTGEYNWVLSDLSKIG